MHKTGTPIGLPLLGIVGGLLVGFLLRPAMPLVGQLPFGVVITRGEYLQGLDLLEKSTAETSFNDMLVGGVIGLTVGLALSRRRRGSAEPASAAKASAPRRSSVPGGTFCSFCGASLVPDAAFCSGCGRKL